MYHKVSKNAADAFRRSQKAVKQAPVIPEARPAVETIAAATKEKKLLRTAYYARVSTAMESQQGSIESQQEHFEEYIRSDPELTLADGYVDYGLSGTKAEDWSVKEAADLMNEGSIVYAGKYRTPDYELILSEGCDLAVENTMIYHDPEVKEKLEELSIPVMVETSSYEKDPRGRLEWIKLYGALYGKETEADDYFEKCEKEITSVIEMDKTGKEVAFFSVTASGSINVRKPDDYIAGLIELAGGNYVPDASGKAEAGGSGTVNMQMEDFYAGTYDADILIYNSTIRGELESVADLAGKNPLFSDYKAVKEQNVYCMTGDFFQHPTDTAKFLSELRNLIEGKDGNYTYFEKLK